MSDPQTPDGPLSHVQNFLVLQLPGVCCSLGFVSGEPAQLDNVVAARITGCHVVIVAQKVARCEQFKGAAVVSL